MRSHVLRTAVLLTAAVAAIPLGGPLHLRLSNNAVAPEQLERPGLVLADTDAMDWETEGGTPDPPQLQSAEILVEDAATDLDSLAFMEASDSDGSDLDDLRSDDCLPEPLFPATASEAECILPVQIPCAAECFTADETSAPSAGHQYWRHWLFNDPDWLDMCETRARAELVDAEFAETSAQGRADTGAAQAAAAVAGDTVPTAHLDGFNAYVDQDEMQVEDGRVPQHIVPEGRVRWSSAAAQEGVQPSIEHAPVQEQDYQGTVQDIVEDRQSEALHTAPGGVHGHRSDPQYVVADVQVNHGVVNDETEEQQTSQPVESYAQVIPRKRLSSKSSRSKRRISAPRHQLSHAEAEVDSGLAGNTEAGTDGEEAELKRRRQGMIDVQEKQGKFVACDGCPRQFKIESGLIAHKKNGDCKNYHCGKGDCQFYSYDAKTVANHRQTHNKTGVYDVNNPYPCEQCPQRFPRKDHLPRHRATAHPPGPTQVPSLYGSFSSATEETRRNIEIIMSDIARVVPSAVSEMDPAEYAMLVAQIMAEDLKTDLCARNKRPAPRDGHTPNTTPAHSNDAQSGSGGGVPRIGDFPVRPIDNDDDLGYGLPSSSRQQPRQRTETGTGGGSSSQASSSQHRSSQDAERDGESSSSGRHRWMQYASGVPPDSRQRRRTTGRRRPVRWDVHPILPDAPDDETAGSDEDKDAEHENEDEDDLYNN
ncbi:hypothetical protein B0A48_12021 [Cryoendolithus antarcticus]|uniref:C2H2-type domain-containing protein n=1 Tax=Cryoendolithus antarcticus TaxID=1507870 RepID=A0A1V8STW7_9PEZI|nr:hypothetical protein B0A48_12021 [Cryoendolithus antarcticus]